MSWLAKLSKVNRRTIYSLLFLFAALPFIFPIRLPLYTWKETRYVFERIDSTPPDKVVAISSEWIAGSQGENWPQYEAVVSHCMMKGIRLVVFAAGTDTDALAAQFSENINRRQAALYGRKYGVDWAQMGLAKGGAPMMGLIGRRFKGAYPTDYYGTSTSNYEKLPIMRDVDNVRAFHMFLAITYQPSNEWLIWLDPTLNTPIAFGSAGIVTTGYYPYIASGQMKGMLAGVRGAAEYETMVAEKYGDAYKTSWTSPDGHKEELRGRKLVVPLAFGHLVIIGFIVIGNIGMIASRRRKA